MPMNYVELQEDEMMYLDGGDAYTFINNVRGIWDRSAGVRAGLRGVGFGNIWAAVSGAAMHGYWWAVGKFGFAAVKIGMIVAGVVGGILATVGTAAAVWYLWNNRVFY